MNEKTPQEKQKILLTEMENMCAFFASKKYLIHGTSAEFRLWDKYAKIMRDQITKETKVYDMILKPAIIEIKEHDQTPEEKYIEELEKRIKELEKNQEKKVEN
jgi:hypothetical protein